MDLTDSFNATFAKMEHKSFSTFEFIDLYKRDFPKEWNRVAKKYGKGGKGQGSHYTSFSYVGRQLTKFRDRGVLTQELGDAPKDWGNKVISVWEFAEPRRENFLPKIDFDDDPVVSAIDDIRVTEVGNDDPEYRKRMAGTYVRDAKVREQVLKRADGFCEECSQPGFRTKAGQPYLETHHVIALSEQGPDRPHNVIALCATDHRRAHFAENWKELQDKFLAKLSKYKSEN